MRARPFGRSRYKWDVIILTCILEKHSESMWNRLKYPLQDSMARFCEHRYENIGYEIT
jgi:hypothetical protein